MTKKKMPLAYYAKKARQVAARYMPYAKAGYNVARNVNRARRAYNTVRALTGSSSNQTNEAGSVRFRDMGERGSVNTTKYGRKRRKMSKRKRKAIKRFRKNVRKAVRAKVPISCLNETWGAVGWDASDADLFGSTLQGGVQFVLGNASSWGLNLGEVAAAGGQESSYINSEMSDYRPRVNGVDITPLASESRWTNSHYVKKRYSKLTIQNLSGTKDLIFDLYECVAAQDIANDLYANPAITWRTLRNNWEEHVTGTAGEAYIKGVEPTDCPQFGHYWKILKKSKVRIPFAANAANAYQTFKMWGKPYNHKGTRFNGKWAVRGITKYWMIIIDPEQGSTRYAGVDVVMNAYCHRNTHYYPNNGEGLHAANLPQWIRLAITAPTQ